MNWSDVRLMVCTFIMRSIYKSPPSHMSAEEKIISYSLYDYIASLKGLWRCM